ncbi:hypothetical protein CISIN_1g035251mg [Citrus sinensis]|uniref:Uncharacterized protein n=1 Tax=Citrus sinensis TaxID=2711 RepID=A0A067E5A2_CITSI|nr:hypothetical protein CISIN_1g035251mg [Citrus sinensis]
MLIQQMVAAFGISKSYQNFYLKHLEFQKWVSKARYLKLCPNYCIIYLPLSFYFHFFFILILLFNNQEFT